MQGYKIFRPLSISDRWPVVCGLSMGFCNVSSDKMLAHGDFCLVHTWNWTIYKAMKNRTTASKPPPPLKCIMQ
jgi:hypothetical protein